MGWLACLGIAVGLTSAAWLSVRRALRRWWDCLAIAAIAALVLVPLYRLVTGDVSRVLPPFLWSDGADGKDQIILASALATFLLPLIFAAWLWRGARAMYAQLVA